MHPETKETYRNRARDFDSMTEDIKLTKHVVILSIDR